jgi:hypothetical protein
MFPPLFPLLISAASFLTNNYEWAGRLVSIVLGALFPLPVLGIAFRLFGWRAAIVAALLTAFHPLFINLSITVFSEGPYATLLLSGVYIVLRALEHSSVKAWCLVGGAFGLAYLVRQEAAAPLLMAAIFALISTDDPLLGRCKRAVASIAVFVVLALPQIALIYRSTGQLWLEGKSRINFAIGTRVLAGQTYWEAGYAINDKLEGVGVWMRPNAEVIRETSMNFKEIIYFVIKATRQNIPILLQHLSARWFGAPFLLALAFLGVFRRSWRRVNAPSHLFVLLVSVTTVVVTFSVTHAVYQRYYFVLVSFMIIWAANGLVEVAYWTRKTVAIIGVRWISPLVPANIVSGVMALGVVIYPLSEVRELGNFREGSTDSRVIKDVGLWIRQQQARPIKIMDLSTPLAFHAGAQYVHFPYSNAESAIRFLDAAKVDYVVLRRGVKFTEYYENWLTHGIPDARAQLVYASSGANPGEIVVFRWRRDGILESPKSDVARVPLSRKAGTVPTVLNSYRPESDVVREALPLLTTGPLHTHARNPRYFADKYNNVVLLAGSHTWGDFQDFGRLGPVPFDYDSYLDSLVANRHNFMRLWIWEQANWVPWMPYDWRISPLPYRRIGPGVALDGGPKFDLEELNPEYFARLRERVEKARIRGIYVAVMLFNGFSIERKGGRPSPFGDPWQGHPFHRENNVNDIDGDQDRDDDGREIHKTLDIRVTRLQEKYVASVIDAVGDLDNVLYEVSNEDRSGSEIWQRHIVRFIHQYEAMKGVQHPVGMTVEYPEGNNEDLFRSEADWISPNRGGGYDHDPPAATGDKVIISDTDHIWGIGGDQSWVWTSLTRGLNVLLMDPYDNEWMFPPRPESESLHWSELRRTIGYARSYLDRLDLSTIVPHGELATTHYCLANPLSGVYLVYIPKRELVTVDTTSSLGLMLQVEWFEPATGKIAHAADVTGGKIIQFTTPYAADAVLLLRGAAMEQ